MRYESRTVINNGAKAIFEEIIDKNFTKLWKDISPQISPFEPKAA